VEGRQASDSRAPLNGVAMVPCHGSRPEALAPGCDNAGRRGGRPAAGWGAGAAARPGLPGLGRWQGRRKPAQRRLGRTA